MYEVRQSEKFRKWFKKIHDKMAKFAIAQRILRMESGNFGDSKSVGGGVFELRIDIGSGYRVYFTNIAGEIILLLVGGDKSRQEADIKEARKLAREAKDD